MARKDYPAAEAITSRRCVWTVATLTPCAGCEYLPPAVARKSRSVYRLALSSQRRSIDDIERSLQNDRLASRQRHWKSRANGCRRQHFSGTTGAGPRQCMDYLPTFTGSRQAGQRSQADTLMRNLAQQKRTTRSRFTLTGCISLVMTRTSGAGAYQQPAARAVEQQYSELVNRLQSDQVLETANRLREAAKKLKRKRCCASNHLPRA